MSNKRCNNRYAHPATGTMQGLRAKLNASTIDLRQKINDGRNARRIIEARRRDRPDRYHDADDSDRFPAFTSNITDRMKISGAIGNGRKFSLAASE
ncbi:hypothetical protein C2845_PM06G27450 [Panicum miliaceum]|uniref:Uncharacterized protein n=1 Tax=Panicum miliaceum TaxID=4540 RepID=A0A3L6RC36_PANMI|nr:hypothetical protein C2845_PM06G27450 [Panicum miliaceum]